MCRLSPTTNTPKFGHWKIRPNAKLWVPHLKTQSKSNFNQTKSPANTPTFVTILSLRRKLHRPVEKAHGKQAQSCRKKYQHVENFNNFGLNIIETVQTWSLWSIHIPLFKLCTCINQVCWRPWLGLVTFYMNKKRGLICLSLGDGCAKHQLDESFAMKWNIKMNETKISRCEIQSQATKQKPIKQKLRQLEPKQHNCKGKNKMF